MAQTVKINGVIYNDVERVTLPLASNASQMAVFPDTSDADAEVADIKKRQNGVCQRREEDRNGYGAHAVVD